jgi:hypothetical protein
MRTFKILIILLVTFVAGIAGECCNCPEIRHYEYSFTLFAVNNVDNSGENPVDVAGQPVNRNVYGIRLRFACQEQEIVSRLPAASVSLIRDAQAVCCFCDDDRYTAKDSVVALKIFTDSVFDGTHPANTDISACFSVYDYNKYVPVNSYTFNSIRPYIYSDNIWITCLLMTPPPVPGEYSFRVEVLLSDGREFVETVKATLI